MNGDGANGHHPVRFETDIRPLFRDRDRQQMLASFDLWRYDDVVRFAAEIAELVTEGSLPSDRPWPDVTVSLFDRWRAEGMAP